MDRLTPDSMNRVAKILMDAGDAPTYDAAQEILQRYVVQVSIAPDVARTESGQAALLTIIATGTRALPGGVYIEGDLDVPLLVGPRPAGTLGEFAKAMGAQLRRELDANAPTARIGARVPLPDGDAPVLDCFFDGWRGGVLPADSRIERRSGARSVLAAMLAGALTVSEVFRYHRGGDARAARCPVGMSLWDLDHCENWWAVDAGEPEIRYLPSALWLIGLGHLGQAYLWVLGMLPYAKPANVLLVLQDFDRLASSNISTSVLTVPAVVGQLKTRAAADWSEARGFRTRIVERKFAANFRIDDGEPQIALCGVDNAQARAALGDVGFDLVVNAGLGAGPVEFMAMRLYTFPGPKAPRAIWGSGARRGALPLDRPAYQALAAAGLDECGITLLAERSVGAPFVGVTAACLAISELLRMLHGGRQITFIDTTLSALDDRHVVQSEPLALRNPGFAEARDASAMP